MRQLLIGFVICCCAIMACKQEIEPKEAYSTDIDEYSSDKADITATNLLTVQQAHELLKTHSEKYIPVQVSKEKVFEKGHLPQAMNIWRPDYASDKTEPYGGLIPERGKLEDLLQSFGFMNGKTLLLYDAKANVDALRFAWVLDLYGFADYKIINGGLEHWKQNGLPIKTGDAEVRQKSDYKLATYFNEKIIATYEDVRAAISDSTTLLIDTRENYEFRGAPFVKDGELFAYKKGAFDRGSIPTAVHQNWSMLADLKGDHRIKSEQDLRHDLESNGITEDKHIILYCHSGSRTSHSYYVLKKVLGYENVKNYDGSWIEWTYRHTQDETVPLQKLCGESEFKIIEDSLKLSLIQ